MPDNTLSDLEHIRKRPSMYLGSVGSTGLMLLAGELISNSIDQFLAGNATQYDLQTDGKSLEISDDGIGIPLDIPAEDGNQSLAEYYCTTLHKTPTADGHAPHIHLHSISGFGLVVVCALSEKLRIRAWRDGNLWEQSFARGVSCGSAAVIDPGDLPEDTNLLKWKKGTEVHLIPDPEIFSEPEIRPTWFRGWAFRSAHLFPGLNVAFQTEKFFAPRGMADLINIYSEHSGIYPFQIREQHSLYDLDLVAYGRAGNTNSKKANSKLFSKITSWVNGRPAIGGSHVDSILEAFENQKWRPKEIFCHVIMKEPAFSGPTRQVLEAPHICASLQAIIEAEVVKSGRGKS